MKDTLNNRVKHREPWRPFAASVLADRVGEYFDLDRPSPYMLLVCNVKPELREKIPAVVHVDGTCRIQTVTKEENGLYYDLIQQFANRTGVPLILNTSYNLAGEPIVETPDDAIKDMLNTNIDMLVIGDLILTKRTSHV
jgi:carbamoyltransferase